MKMVILCMRDNKAGIYTQPFASLSIATASRDLGDAINDPQGTLPWQKHPEDFDLYRLATFNDENGMIEVDEGDRINICNLATFRQPRN